MRRRYRLRCRADDLAAGNVRVNGGYVRLDRAGNCNRGNEGRRNRREEFYFSRRRFGYLGSPSHRTEITQFLLCTRQMLLTLICPDILTVYRNIATQRGRSDSMRDLRLAHESGELARGQQIYSVREAMCERNATAPKGQRVASGLHHQKGNLRGNST